MIIIRVSGGIGNQFFQYATGRALAIRNNTELKIENSFYSKFSPETTPREYLLPFFNTAGVIATDADFKKIGVPSVLDKTIFGKIKRKLFKYHERTKPIYSRKFVIEPDFTFCPDILKIKDNCYLSGSWQSEKYFIDKEDVIRKELALKNEMSADANEWIEKIKKCNSISLHIRRGDYVTSPVANQYHGTCNIGYYEKAIDFILKKTDVPEFFIFSDDIEWAKHNLRIKSPVHFVSDIKIPDYEELMLMSGCRHNIIANSSFSWWGAWLNDNLSKIVIAPQAWFYVKNKNIKDLILKDWIMI